MCLAAPSVTGKGHRKIEPIIGIYKLAHEDLGHFEEAHHWNIQAKFYNEKFPLVYESDNMRDSLL